VAGLKQRLARLEKCVPRPVQPPDNPARKAVLKRLDRLLRDVTPLLSPDEDKRIEEALRAWIEDKRGPYNDWMRGLFDGWSRLPILRPEVMKELLLTWLSPNVDNFSQVCTECGLQLPAYKLPPISEWKAFPKKIQVEGEPPQTVFPNFFPTCPHCGASRKQRDWAHLARDKRYPWQALDGFVTPKQH
jgi:hypothetical protein